MFSLLSGFWIYFFSKPNIHVLIIGLDYSGKTTVLEKIKSRFSKIPGLPPEKIPPTIGMNLAKINYQGSQVIFWDLGGQLKMRSIWEKYYDEANAVVFVIDSVDVGRLSEAKLALATASDNLKGVPIFVLANKQDLAGALSSEEISDLLNGMKLDHHFKVFPISAINGDGIDNSLLSIIHEAKVHAKG